jgi:hypothetical protein
VPIKTFNKKSIIAVTLLFSSILLAGCSNSSNYAIKVGSETVSENQIQNSVNEILSERQKLGLNASSNNLPTGQQLISDVIQTYLSALVLNEVSKEQGINLTPAIYEKLKATFIQEVGGANLLPATLLQHDVAPQDFELIAHSNAIQQALAAKAKFLKLPNTNNEAITSWVNQAISQVGIIINPRYGKWDSQTESIAAASATDAVVAPGK